MDEAGRLISELQQKLKELDHRVWLYRRDMTLEFTKYAETLLRDVPQDISNTVSVVISQSLKEYPSLWPPHELDSDDTSATTINEITTAMLRKTAIPIFLDVPQHQSDVPRSPHAREQEFQGLFTPTYLPLLDSSDRHERRPNKAGQSPPMCRPSDSSESGEVSAEKAPVRLSTSLSPTANDRLPLRPNPKRRSTDDGSAFSSSSNSPIRRSALRHSTGSVKVQSPRRVRFEFAGEEFETTSSPKDTSPILSSKHDGLASDDDDESSDEPVTEQIEYVESPPSPPPKRVSSSQALRALSRQPMDDDGTQWTQVSAPPDGSASVPISDVRPNDDEEDDLPDFTLAASHRTHPTASSQDSTEDDEIVPPDDMPPLEPMPSQRQVTILSAATNGLEKSSKSTRKSPVKPLFTLDDVDEDEVDEDSAADPKLQFTDNDDVLFQFDETRPTFSRPGEADEDDEQDSSSEHDDDYPLPEQNLSQYATSPARTIVRPKTVEDSNAVVSSIRGSVHPFNTPVVNEAAHAQAASLGAVNTVFGSLRDHDDSVGSYNFRANTPIAGSTSKSGNHPLTMSERMRMESGDTETEI